MFLGRLAFFEMTRLGKQCTETGPWAIRSASARRLEGPACTSTAYMTALGERGRGRGAGLGRVELGARAEKRRSNTPGEGQAPLHAEKP